MKIDNLKEITGYVLKKVRAEQAEVIVSEFDTTTIRFAQNLIHQPTSVKSYWLNLRVINKKHIGVASTNSLDKRSLEVTISQAEKLCRLQRPDEGFTSLPKSAGKYKKVNSFDEATAHVQEKDLIEKTARVIKKASGKNLLASGQLTRSVDDLVIANTLGILKEQKSTTASFSTIMMGKNNPGSGYAGTINTSLARLSLDKLSEKAITKALSSSAPRSLIPGEYEVVFEPAALEEILDFFAYLGPNARIYHEDVSYLKGRLGKKIFSDKLTITDEPLAKKGLPNAFDFEGVNKKPLTIIKNGVVKNICYDSYYAQKYNKKNTGHALPSPNTAGPMPMHLVIYPGKSRLSSMIRKVKKGLLVSRLWYIRVIHYRDLILTGMTRDGTFYIENGKIKYPVNNLRFTDSIPNLFKNIQELGKKTVLQSGWGGAFRVPAIRVKKFRFTS